jgi:hypothetical protein
LHASGGGKGCGLIGRCELLLGSESKLLFC